MSVACLILAFIVFAGNRCEYPAGDKSVLILQELRVCYIILFESVLHNIVRGIVGGYYGNSYQAS